jgi:peptide chain release factor 1
VDATLRGKIERIADRHEELGEMLCDPEVVRDKPRFLEYSREHADLSPIAEAFLRHHQAEQALTEAMELIADPDMRELAEQDARDSRKILSTLEAELQRRLIPKDPNDSKNVILEIRAGTGGDEAAIFAGDLWRMYSRFAERNGWRVQNVEYADSAAGGFKEVSGLFKGKDAYAKLKFERGVHRVQRVPATESQGRIHTSAATVAIMPEAEAVDIEINPADLRIDVMRASGAGGQHVNTTDSAVRITHEPTGIAVHVQQEKSQMKNRDIAMQRLRSRLLAAKIERYETERAADRKQQVGSGDRSEKVRTYNYPQDRITDHRVNLTRHNLAAFMDGELGSVIDALRAHDQASRLAEAQVDD